MEHTGVFTVALLLALLQVLVAADASSCGHDGAQGGGGGGGGGGSGAVSSSRGTDFLVGLVNLLVRAHVNALNNLSVLSPLLGR